MGGTPIAEELDARRAGFDADGAWELLKSAEEILVARGRRLSRFDPKRDARDAILEQAIGPSGKLRAPALRRGGAWLIGFHEEGVRELLA